jgi:hypothetical protein
MSAAHKNIAVRCPACDRTVGRRSRQQIFCSTRCRKRAHKAPWTLKTPVSYHPSEEGTNPPKSPNENNVLQWPKTGSSLTRNGPINLLGGGSWKWPKAGKLDRKTRAKIRWCEVGGEFAGPPRVIKNDATRKAAQPSHTQEGRGCAKN